MAPTKARRASGRSQGALTLRVQVPKPAPAASGPASSDTVPSIDTANPSTEKAEGNAEDEVVNSIAALTLDVPLIPFNRKRRVPSTPFHFLSLPSEIRIKIYEHFFDDNNAEDVIDLGPDNYKRYHGKLRLMRVCRQVHDEATHLFYSTRTFRLFPTHPGKYLKSKKPLLARLKKCQRECIQSLQLRLGPNWSQPPRGWLVNDALGLEQCTNLRKLQVYVECDPSDPIFKGFRRSEGFYATFSQQLMTEVVNTLPAVKAIQFDGFPSVKKKGPMIQGLVEQARKLGMTVCWGPERGWTDVDVKEDEVVVDEKNPFMQLDASFLGTVPDHYGHHNVQVFA